MEVAGRDRSVVGRVQWRVDLAARVDGEDPEILAEHFLALVAGMPARLASLGIARDPADEEHRLEVAVRLFLRALRPR